jgi:hypothetical protein
MNILELDSYNLDDAVKFHDHLNPRLWDDREHLRPDVREALLKIAEDFREFLGVSDLNLKDITVSGSNAAYTYTPNSDIDLHLVIDAPKDEVYRELFDAKKYAYNDQHNIKIGGYDVELYVEDYGHPPRSQGIYSVLNNDWVSVPRRGGAKVDDLNTKQKFETLGRQIESAIKSKKLSRLTNLFSKIKKMRQSGLEAHGEFGPENLAFKMLRNQGLIEKLVTARNEAKAQELSLKEKAAPQRIKYGFKSVVDEASTPDGVSPSTCMFLDDEEPGVKSDEEILKDFVDFVIAELKIEHMPAIKLRKDPQWPVVHKTFGRYIDDKHMLEVAWGSRHIMDVLRTVAHELTHKHQHEREDVPASAGETGSEYENEANARAGILMRDYARLHPDYFAVGQAEELNDDDIEEGALSKAAMAAALAAGLSGPAQAQSTGDAVNAARAAYNLRNITQAGVRDEMSQELRNYIRAQGGDPGSQNLSHLYKLQNRKPQQVVTPQQQDVPVNAPAMPVRRGQQNESASGYIPTKKQAKDPRFSMALTVDIKPGQVGKEANKLGLETDKQGKPALVMKARNQIAESLAEELEKFKKSKSYGYNSTPLSQVPGEQEDDLGNQEATGPEFPPQMPAGTTKIDVTDLTDWYRLGMDISDLDDADPEDYNQGPPQTVVVFPSDEAEQGYLKQFKRLGLKTHDMDPDVEGGEDVTGKHQPKEDDELIAESIDDMLFEINMGSKNLRREAAKTGAIAGMEFEMIVPNVEGNDDEGEMEPDYDYDESVGGIQDAYDFFYDGDYNSRGDVTRLREKMQNEYWEWLSEAFDTRWDGDESEFVYNYLKENASADEIAEILGIDVSDGSEYVADKQAYRDATEKVIEESYGNYWYDAAREDAQEDFNQNADLESDWLESRDLGAMSDIANEYGINWPHWQSVGNGGETSIEDVAQDFENHVDRDTRASGAYHSGRVERPSPTAQHYIVEPDGSLEGDEMGDTGLEFVSPPLPIDEILSDLNKVKKWAKVYGCYTNESTGLHINISVPNYSRENLDFVKLALLMGDEYVLDLFGRAGNTYAKPAIKMVRDQVRQKPDEAERLLDKMKGNLDSLASKAIHSGITSKYTSINTKDGHIEFRSPGGDWLDQNFDQIENTLMRFTVAMSAALNPEMYREEYLKKLYKLLTQDEKGSDTIKYFSEYVAGKIPAAALRSFVKQAQLERKVQKDPTGGEKYWWNVSWGNGRVEVVARNKQEAIDTAFKESYWAPDEPDTPQAKQFKGSLRATPLRPFDQSSVKAKSGDPQQVSGSQYEIFNPSTQQVAAAFLAPNDEAALVRLDQYQRSHPDDPFIVRTANGIELVGLDIPMAAGRAATSATGQWKIIDGLNREVYRFRPAENTRAKANELAALWARENNFDGNYQVDPVEDTVAGSTTDLAQQRATPGTFTGAWKIVDANGNELYRFSGIGNQQRDANRLATVWMQNNGYDYGTEIEVLPIMS